jgi:hypothetical protein
MDIATGTLSGRPVSFCTDATFNFEITEMRAEQVLHERVLKLTVTSPAAKPQFLTPCAHPLDQSRRL